MNFGIQKRRGTQLRAGWSNFLAVSSRLRSIYAKSVDLLRSAILCCFRAVQEGARGPGTRHGGAWAQLRLWIHIPMYI